MSCLSKLVLDELRNDKTWIRISNIKTTKRDLFEYIQKNFGQIYTFISHIELKDGNEFFKDGSVRIEMATSAVFKLIDKSHVVRGSYAPPNSILSDQSSESSSEERSSPEPHAYNNPDSLLLDIEVELSDSAEHYDQPVHVSIRYDSLFNCRKKQKISLLRSCLIRNM